MEMDKDIEKIVKNCDECQLHQKAPAEAPLHLWEWPGQPIETWNFFVNMLHFVSEQCRPEKRLF